MKALFCNISFDHTLMKPIFIILSLILFNNSLAAEVGESAPNFSIKELVGNKTLSLDDYRGSLIYLDFWASWCPPCLISLPQMDLLRDKLLADGIELEVLAVSVDTDIDEARYFIEDHPVKFKVLTDSEGFVPAAYQIKAMPTSFLIDRNGQIAYEHKGFKLGDEIEIERLIRELW
jgi:peroxiredoxin